MMSSDHVIPVSNSLLRNSNTGEHYPFHKIEEAHPEKVEFLLVNLPNGEVVQAMCLSVEGGYAVYFQGLHH